MDSELCYVYIFQIFASSRISVRYTATWVWPFAFVSPKVLTIWYQVKDKLRTIPLHDLFLKSVMFSLILYSVKSASMSHQTMQVLSASNDGHLVLRHAFSSCVLGHAYGRK